MKIRLYTCGGEGLITDYESKLLEVGIKLIPSEKTDDYGDPVHYVEVDTIEDLFKIIKVTGYDLVIEKAYPWTDHEPVLRIYDGYLE